jgi:hypothetical protein
MGKRIVRDGLPPVPPLKVQNALMRTLLQPELTPTGRLVAAVLRAERARKRPRKGP